MAVLNKDKRIALTSIVHHYCLQTQETRTDIAKNAGLSDRGRGHLDNFLQKAAPNASDKIFSYFKNIVTEENYYNLAPDYIKQAIRAVYDVDHKHVPTPLEKISSAIVDQTETLLDSISNIYRGCWDVIRYSGQSLVARKPYVIRAALEVYPRDGERKGALPAFCIHYRPLSKMVTKDFFVVDGCVMPLMGGHHMYFFGRELESDYPLDIVANQSRQAVTSFEGIVKRKQESGQILVSRVMFLRSKQQNIKDLTPKVGTFLETEFKDDCKDEIHNIESILKSVRNYVPDRGKGCLLL
jgi:hypothetical protein